MTSFFVFLEQCCSWGKDFIFNVESSVNLHPCKMWLHNKITNNPKMANLIYVQDFSEPQWMHSSRVTL